MTKTDVYLYEYDTHVPAGIIVDSREGVFGVRISLDEDRRRCINLMAGDDGHFWDMEKTSGYDPYWLDAMIEVLQEAKKALAEGNGIPAGRALK